MHVLGCAGYLILSIILSYLIFHPYLLSYYLISPILSYHILSPLILCYHLLFTPSPDTCVPLGQTSTARMEKIFPHQWWHLSSHSTSHLLAFPSSFLAYPGQIYSLQALANRLKVPLKKVNLWLVSSLLKFCRIQVGRVQRYNIESSNSFLVPTTVTTAINVTNITTVTTVTW